MYWRWHEGFGVSVQLLRFNTFVAQKDHRIGLVIAKVNYSSISSLFPLLPYPCGFHPHPGLASVSLFRSSSSHYHSSFKLAHATYIAAAITTVPVYITLKVVSHQCLKCETLRTVRARASQEQAICIQARMALPTSLNAPALLSHRIRPR